MSNKRVYVTDQGNDRVSVFDADKLKWLFLRQLGLEAGRVLLSRGVCAHEPSNELYVADFRNHRIQVFSLKDADKAKCPSVRIIGGGGRALGSSTAGRFRGRLEVRRHEMPRTKLLQQHACLSAPTAVLPSRSLLT